MQSPCDNPLYIARAVVLNASGYLLKGCTRDELLDARRNVAAGGGTWTRDRLHRVTGELTAQRLNADVGVFLTRREGEVLQKIAYGLSNEQIADALAISYATVSQHVQSVFRKIDVTDRTQAAVWALHKGLG